CIRGFDSLRPLQILPPQPFALTSSGNEILIVTQQQVELRLSSPNPLRLARTSDCRGSLAKFIFRVSRYCNVYSIYTQHQWVSSRPLLRSSAPHRIESARRIREIAMPDARIPIIAVVLATFTLSSACAMTPLQQQPGSPMSA